MSRPITATHHPPPPPPIITPRPVSQRSDGTIQRFIEQLRHAGQSPKQYTILSQVGKGKFSTVYKCSHAHTLYALKRVDLFSQQFSEASRDKCIREIQLLQSLEQHSGIVQYIDSYIEHDTNQLIIILQWASGGDLKRLIKRVRGVYDSVYGTVDTRVPAGGVVVVVPKQQVNGGGRAQQTYFPEQQIWRYIYEVSYALYYMHSHRIMHRDLKPANIMLSDSNHVLLGDLGLSRYMSEQTVEAYSKVGTPLYIAPEVLTGDGYTYTADVWSLGCIAYELCALISPFKPQTSQVNLYALFNAIRGCTYERIQTAAKHQYSDTLYDLVTMMLSLDPDDRPTLDSVIMLCAAQCHDISKLAPLPHWPVQQHGVTMADVRGGELMVPVGVEGINKRATSATTIKQAHQSTMNTPVHDKENVSNNRQVPADTLAVQRQVDVKSALSVLADSTMSVGSTVSAQSVASKQSNAPSQLLIPSNGDPVTTPGVTAAAAKQHSPKAEKLTVSRLPVGSPVNKVSKVKPPVSHQPSLYDAVTDITHRLSVLRTLHASDAAMTPNISNFNVLVWMQHTTARQLHEALSWCVWLIRLCSSSTTQAVASSDVETLAHMVDTYQSAHDTYIYVLRYCQSHQIGVGDVATQTSDISVVMVLQLVEQLAQHTFTVLAQDVMPVQYINTVQHDVMDQDEIDELVDDRSDDEPNIFHKPEQAVNAAVSKAAETKFELTPTLEAKLVFNPKQFAQIPSVHAHTAAHNTYADVTKDMQLHCIAASYGEVELIAVSEVRLAKLIQLDVAQQLSTAAELHIDIAAEYASRQAQYADLHARTAAIDNQTKQCKQAIATVQAKHNDVSGIKQIRTAHTRLLSDIKSLDAQLANTFFKLTVQ